MTRHWYDLDVQAWQDRGVDISSLLDLALFIQEGDPLMHGDFHCGAMSDSAGQPFAASVTLESLLCEECWYMNAPSKYADFADAVLALSDSEGYLEMARTKGLTGPGFRFLLKGISRLPADDPIVGSLATEVRTEFLQAFSAELGDRASYRANVLYDYDLPADTPDALLFMSRDASSFFGIRLGASSPWVLERFAAAWVPDAPVSGHLFRGPAPLLYHLLEVVYDSGRYSFGVHVPSIGVLRDDPDDVVDTALRLLDPDSSSLDTLEAVFAVSRKLHA